jgi:hypothetical protein
VLGAAQCRVAEHRVDRGEAGVAGPDAVAAVVFEVVQERGDDRRVEVGELQPGRGLAGPLCREGEQQLPRVAVGGGGVAAGALLPGQPFGEECFEGGGEGGHGCPPWSSRDAARASSSGVPVRYQ